MDKPWPDGFIFGGTHDFTRREGDLERVGWWCIFNLEGGETPWSCTYRVGPEDEAPDVDALKGHGQTPKDAFESLIRVYSFANGGEESPVLRIILPGLRRVFKEDGFVWTEEQLENL